ncbi:MAG: hypothetical protein JSW50_09280 [Candidatus Latescibacterota bacterium]|nr:MAG: hypothetical protein JSW50_09280 [Candidatus Latescibacterota bacterium]
MKSPARYLAIVIAVIGVFVFAASSGANPGEKTVAFFAGVNHYLGEGRFSHNFTTHQLSENGLTIGFLLPINVPIDLYFKGQLYVHDVEDVGSTTGSFPEDDLYYRNLDIYMGGANEVAIGKKIGLGESFFVEPLIGFGVLVNVIYGNGGEGIAWGAFGIDFSARGMYTMTHLNLGLQVSLQLIPWDGYFNPADGKTVNVTAVVSR